MRRNTPLTVGDTVELEIEALAPTGLGVGRYRTPDGWVSVFVPHTAPGDAVRCRVARIYKRYAEADLVHLLQPSPHRTEPACPHFFECGACELMHIEYDKQLAFKADAASFVLKRAGVEAPYETIAPGSPLRYRARAELHCIAGRANRPRVGYFARRSHELVELSGCKVLVAPCEESLRALPDLLARCLPVSRPGTDELYFKTAIVWEYPQDSALVWIRLKALRRSGTAGLYRVRGDKAEPLTGEPVFRFPSDAVELVAHPDSFTQVNWAGNSRLVREVVGIASEIGPRSVLELHAGVGNFTVHLAAIAGRTTAVEAGKKETALLRKNLELLEITNVSVQRSLAERVLERAAASGHRPDLVVCDPPRGGLGPKAADSLASLAPDHIIYVSCNPASLARDLKTLIAKYELRMLKFIDLFPQTPHIETVLWLSRKG
ncbi:MAG TPA: class I SAM-dependent RNA methyltransferase [Proteobacteria bacterium]|nr:class I SAM-dependent RNA methyltransferase [Pseudomonadota bacterium]